MKKIKKDGTPFSRAHTCHECGGAGMRYVETGEVAGLKIFPPDSTWVTANGFSTDKNKLRVLAKQLKSLNPDKHSDAIEFLEKVERLGAVETYLSAFVEGIKKRLIGNMLYADFNQCRTATGRLSSLSLTSHNWSSG